MKIVNFLNQKLIFIFLFFATTSHVFAPQFNTISPENQIMQSFGQLITEQKTLLKLLREMIFEHQKKLENELRQAMQQKKRLLETNAAINVINAITRKITLIGQQLEHIRILTTAVDYHDKTNIFASSLPES